MTTRPDRARRSEPFRSCWPRVGLFLTLGLAAALPAQAATSLSLEQAIQAALEHHERAAIARAGRQAASARVGQAWSVLLPSLRLDLDRSEYASEGGASGSSSYEGWEARAGASQLLFDAQALPLVGQARHDSWAAVERRELAIRSLTEIQVRREAGLVGSNDLTRAELELASTEREWVQASGLAVDVDTDYQVGMPELRVMPDRARCADLGIPVEDVAGAWTCACACWRASARAPRT